MTSLDHVEIRRQERIDAVQDRDRCRISPVSAISVPIERAAVRVAVVKDEVAAWPGVGHAGGRSG